MFKTLLFSSLLAFLTNFANGNDYSLIERIDSLINKAESFKKANPDSALPYYQEAINLVCSILTKSRDDVEKKILTEKYAFALMGAGSEYFNLGNYSDAMKNFMTSFDLYQKTGNLELLAQVHICLGRTYRCYGPEMFGKAMREMKTADSIFNYTGNINGKALALKELGWIYGDNISAKTYNLDSALYYFNKAWFLMKDSGNGEEMANIKNGIAWVLNELGQHSQALVKAKEALQYFEKIQSLNGLCHIHYTLGCMYSQSGNYKPALDHLNASLTYSRKTGNLDKENNILEMMAENYLKMKDYKNAYDFYHQSVEKKFELLSSEKIRTIEEMKAKFETRTKELEISNLSKQKILQFRIIVLLTIGIALIIGILLVGLRFYKAKRIANRLLRAQNLELNQKNEEITSQRDEIINHRNELQGINDLLHSKNEEITRQHEQLYQLNATKDKFFSIIAHDLRGPIGNLNSFLELLIDNESKYSKEELTEYLAKLKVTSNTTYRLLENLLTWARAQQGEIVYKPAKNNLSELIRANLDLFNSSAEKKQISLVFDNKEDLIFDFDRDMIHSVIRNLISNALKYTPLNGQINITVKEIKNTIEIRIKDSGIGMQPDQIDHLFSLDIKHQSVEGTDGEKGTGLGLIICKEFIEKHEGTIRVESVYREGSQIIFTLPLRL